MTVTSWRIPLRIAHRTARRSLGRSVLIAILIGLPVLARQLLGSADASVTVTVTPKITVERAMMDSASVSYIVGEQDSTRDPARVDVAALLPGGSRVVAAPYRWTSALTLKVGDATGNYPIVGLDARTALTTGTYRRDGGRLPTGAGEVALSPRSPTISACARATRSSMAPPWRRLTAADILPSGWPGVLIGRMSGLCGGCPARRLSWPRTTLI